jgi:C4-dicarboxylate-specific signal transduction histidine kinase
VDPDHTAEGSEAEALPRLAHELRERVKELDCLFGVSEIVERAGGSLESVFAETVELLPRSWDHSDVAAARITLGERDFRSRGYRSAPWTQVARISVHGREAGAIEIVYLKSRPLRDEGPFSREERRLLNAVAERLGHVVERLTADERLREREEEFREKMTHFTRISTMGEMASSIAHEVNQPLTAVATYAQAGRRLVESGAADATEVLEVLERIGEEALRAGDIINRLRGMVRRRESHLVECDINSLLEEILPLVSVDARMNEIDLEFRLPADSSLVLADGVQIQQVVLNLIRNGIDAMADTPVPARTLEVDVTNKPDAEVEVRVADRGCGLPDATERTLFEPFFTTKKAGLGLGLSISKTIISAHGGRLSFSKNPKGGTIFYFTLPTVRDS